MTAFPNYTHHCARCGEAWIGSHVCQIGIVLPEPSVSATITISDARLLRDRVNRMLDILRRVARGDLNEYGAHREALWLDIHAELERRE